MSGAGKPQRPRSRRTPALRHLYLAPITARVRWKAEPATRDWWYVQFGASDGNPAHGWVCEKNHPNTSWQSPWAWPGFEIVDASKGKVDGFPSDPKVYHIDPIACRPHISVPR